MAISPTDPLAGPAPLTAAPRQPPPSGRGLLSEIGRHRNDYLWVAPALLVMLLVIAYPFVYTIDLSFYNTPPSSPNWYFNGVDNYVQVLSDPAFWSITLNTVYWAVGSTVLAFRQAGSNQRLPHRQRMVRANSDRASSSRRRGRSRARSTSSGS